MNKFVSIVFRPVVTLAMVALAIVAGLRLFDYYINALGPATGACAPMSSPSRPTFQGW